MGEVVSERNILRSKGAGYPLVSFTVKDGVTPKTERYDREQLVIGDTSKKLYKETRLDDIVYNPANLKFGAIARNKYGNAVFSPIYITLEACPSVVSPAFVEMLVTRRDFINRALKYQQGTVYERMAVSVEDLVKMNIRVPSLPEQRRIGGFFSTLDSLIAAAERQEDLLKQKKQAYLQLMFPQEGETEPRLRFAGFSGEWQQKMVGDLVGKTFGGGTPSTSNSEYWIGRLPWIQSSNLADGQIFRVDVEKHISDIALQHSSAQLIPAGSIAVVTHVGVGKLALVPFEYSTSQDFISLGDLKCDSRFLSLALQERLRKDLRVVQGSTIKGITKQDLLHKKLTLPKQRDEQARIATFLMLFGKTIAQINERKALLQRMKEAYLQRLFL